MDDGRAICRSQRVPQDVADYPGVFLHNSQFLNAAILRPVDLLTQVKCVKVNERSSRARSSSVRAGEGRSDGMAAVDWNFISRP